MNVTHKKAAAGVGTGSRKFSNRTRLWQGEPADGESISNDEDRGIVWL
ncbi:MAG: hypothetical protein AAF220_12935 [Pseudomonadota bacterium]